MTKLIILSALSAFLIQPAIPDSLGSPRLRQSRWAVHTRNERPSSKWLPATYRGLTMGRSTRADMIRVFGKPKFSEVFVEAGSSPEDWYHYDDAGEFPGEVIVNVDKLTGRILRITLQPKSLLSADATRHFGKDYGLKRYEFCPGFEEQESAPLYENAKGQFRYIEYRKRGIALALTPMGEVGSITYGSGPVGVPSSKCKRKR